MFPSRRSVLAGAALAAAAVLPTGAGAAAADAWRALPDLTGYWSVVQAPLPRPPYKADWAAKQRQAAGALRGGKLEEPGKVCGLPHGNPWMLGLSDIHEWIVRPDGVWHNVENTGMTSRIYTDGRPHLSAEDIFPTYTGDTIGRWEGDTLVAETTALRDDTWLGPGALIHSDQLRLTQRIRKTGPDRMEVQLVAEDPVAFTQPWRVTYRYRRLPANTVVREYACGIIRRAGD
jgi:hypothetical protein